MSYFDPFCPILIHWYLFCPILSKFVPILVHFVQFLSILSKFDQFCSNFVHFCLILDDNFNFDNFFLDRLVSQISNALLLYATDEKMLNLEKFSDESSTEESDQENSLSDGEIFQSSVAKPSRPALLCRRRTISGPQQGNVKKI